MMFNDSSWPFAVIAQVGIAVIVSVGCTHSLAQEATDAERCAALQGRAWESVEGAPTRILSSRLVTVPPSGLDQPASTMTWPIDKTAIKEYCEVRGYVAPQSQFELRLPLRSDWNGKFFFFACAGFCGTVNGSACNAGLAKGYASVTSNGGHFSAPGFDGLWAENAPVLQREFAYSSNHKVTVAAKAITQAYYGARPQRSFMAGCSKGGQAGLMAALKYPADYDGIIVAAPVYDYTGKSVIHGAWIVQANDDGRGGYLIDDAAAKLVNRSIIEACDELDGAKDGLVTDPMQCAWKPRDLLCSAGQSDDTCLSARQVTALERIYAAPTDRRGRVIFPTGNELGSETEWSRWVYRIASARPQGSLEVVERSAGERSAERGPERSVPRTANFDVSQQFLRYLTAANTKDLRITTDPLRFDFDRDPGRLMRARAIYDSSSVDLAAFKARGGKILMWHGWADAGIPPRSSIDYYLRVVQAQGSRAETESFLRLFMLPGVHHCVGGYGPDQVDTLTALDRWVADGTAPDALMTQQSQDGRVVRTRPVYPYPVVPRYLGNGPTTEAASYGPVDPWAGASKPPMPKGVYR